MVLSKSLLSRRSFLQSSIATTFAATPLLTGDSRSADSQAPVASPGKPLVERFQPITPEEFQSRAHHAQELMSAAVPKIDALIMGPGSSLYYFTGIHWGLTSGFSPWCSRESANRFWCVRRLKSHGCANRYSIRQKFGCGKRMKTPQS